MILVHGPDEPLVRAIVGHLLALEHPAQALAADAHLFTEAIDKKASAVVGVLPAHANEDEALAEVAALVQASAAPRPPKVVLVTPGAREGAALRALRKSGAAYAIVPRTPLGPLPAPGKPLETVWLARDLLAPEWAMETQPGLLRTVASALREDAPVGVEFAPEREGWDTVLRSAGYRVRAVPNWLALAAGRCGLRALYLSSAGDIASRLERAPRRLVGLLPAPRAS